MALFYRKRKQLPLSSLLTDLGTDPNLVTQVQVSCSPHLSNQSSIYVFICVSETSFIMAWTRISSSISDGCYIIQKGNLKKTQTNNTQAWIFLPCFLQNSCLNIHIDLCPRITSDLNRNSATTLLGMVERSTQQTGWIGCPQGFMSSPLKPTQYCADSSLCLQRAWDTRIPGYMVLCGIYCVFTLL